MSDITKRVRLSLTPALTQSDVKQNTGTDLSEVRLITKDLTSRINHQRPNVTREMVLKRNLDRLKRIDSNRQFHGLSSNDRISRSVALDLDTMEDWIKEYVRDEFLFFQDLDVVLASGVKRGHEHEMHVTYKQYKALVKKMKTEYKQLFPLPMSDMIDVRERLSRYLSSQGLTLKTENLLQSNKELRHVFKHTKRDICDVSKLSDSCVLKMYTLIVEGRDNV
jgi:uncharacterized protein YktA (UPF0223 family)